jgi:hypothetical protein
MPIRAWLARLLEPTSPPYSEPAEESPSQQPRGSKASLGLECLEERSLLSTGTGLTGQYFASDHFEPLKVARTDPTVNFSWGVRSPASGVPGSQFSVRWSGWVQPLYSQTYTFSTRTDDGVRLNVGGQTLINAWSQHGVQEDSGTIWLVAGQKYWIQMDYIQDGGAAQAQLLWSSPSQAKQVIPASQLFPASAAPVANVGPRAQLSAGNVTTAGAGSSFFTVSYQDSDGIEASSLRTGNVRVTGPNGFSQLATLVGVDRAGNGTPRTATYRITPPGWSWDIQDNGTYTISLLANQVKDVKGAFAPAVTLGTFRVAVPAPDWFSTNLHDPNLRNLVRTLDADHTLNRTDMMAIFREVEEGSVTATELGDLRTLVANASRLGMPDYVRDLSGDVIGNDPANLHYRGNTLGYLHAGSSGSQLEMLVEKWFLGTDHPVAASNTHYVYAQGSLFGSGPVYTDIQQGWIGDCYFLGGLAEVAFRSPAALRNMFIDNGDGTYTVRFLENGTPTYVTVDRYLPVDSRGQLPYAHTQRQAGSAGDKLWVALAEKAYAQLAESGWSRPSAPRNAYDSLSVGWEGDAVEQITGRGATYLRINGTGSLGSIVNAFRSGALLGLDSKPVTWSSVVPDHTYAMVGYNPSTGLFTLYNPWGMVQVVNGSTIAANFDHWNQLVN